MLSLLLVFLFSGSCLQGSSFDARLQSIVKPYRFSIAVWELKNLPREIGQGFSGKPAEDDNEARIVSEYFTSIKRIRTLQSEIGAASAGNGQNALAPLEEELNRLQEQETALSAKVERIIEKQVRDTLARQGIFNPVIRLRVSFPAVNFKLEKLPDLLVISSRYRIESIREITLKPGLILEEKEDIEASIDELGVSSLVTGIGGIATYPTLVGNEASLQSAIETVTHEWLHQYLAFKPLGFRYLLDLAGVSRNYEIATMNETLAGMVSKELGSLVYEKYYSEYENDTHQTPEPDFDFNLEMREIRKKVDEYLARDQIGAAEQFMEEKRQYLASRGYYIRKLNQAYFAFHGTYADSPAFISPIGLELKELRNRSSSLKDFLNTAAAMTSRQDLKDSLQ
ncbi:MAG: hypothetical protein Q8O55_07695 [Dehalococcoidales bacterium]|nr:hypothetical protein [Dehalococcoidales bacterium]